MKWLVWSGRVVLVALLVLFVVALRPETILHQFDGGFWLGLLLAQFPFLAAVIILAARHVILVGHPYPSVFLAFKALLIASALNGLVPGQLAEVTKATYLRDKAGVPIATGLSATVVGRILDLLVIVGFGIIGVTLYQGTDALLFLIPLFAALALTLVFLPRLLRLLHSSVQRIGRPKLERLIQTLVVAFEQRRSSLAMPASVIITVVSWSAYVAGVALFMHYASGPDLTPVQLLLLVVAGTLGTSVPLFPGGLGTFEGATVLALSQFGFPLNEAAAIALGLRLNNIVVIMPLGLVLAALDGTGLSSGLGRLVEFMKPK